jgi:DNA-binding NtrC family response regulator
LQGYGNRSNKFIREKALMILLLSSDPVVRATLKEALERAEHVVLATGSLGTAVDMLADCEFDLLITHPYVDGIPGHEAAKYLRGKNPHMAVMLVAGLLDDDRLRYRSELEGFEIFPPPFSTAQLIETVAQILKRREPGAAQTHTD